MTIELTVVKKNQLLFFEDLNGNSLNYLRAADFFAGGKLIVKRDGSVFDETREISRIGNHALTTCFRGLMKVHADTSIKTGLFSRWFREGDVIEIEIPDGRPPTQDFFEYLQEFATGMEAACKILEAYPRISLPDFDIQMKTML